MGRSTVSGEIRRERGLARLSLTIAGDSLEVEFSPAFAGANGDTHPTRRAAASNKVDLEIRAGEPAETPLPLAPPSPGDPARR